MQLTKGGIRYEVKRLAHNGLVSVRAVSGVTPDESIDVSRWPTEREISEVLGVESVAYLGEGEYAHEGVYSTR